MESKYLHVAVILGVFLSFMHQTEACCWRKPSKKGRIHPTPDYKNRHPIYTRQMPSGYTKSPVTANDATLFPTQRSQPANDATLFPTQRSQPATENPRKEEQSDNSSDIFVISVAVSAAVFAVVVIVIIIVVLRNRHTKKAPPIADEDIAKAAFPEIEKTVSQDTVKKAPLDIWTVSIPDHKLTPYDEKIAG